jgi:type IV secretion system protein VirB1
MSTTLAALIAACAPLVHPTTMLALITVESAANPYAISINRPDSWRVAGIELPTFPQPQTAASAQQLVTRLESDGFTTSVGLAQINTEHLAKWQLPLTALLDPCTNLQLAQAILIDCAADDGRATLPQILSCFNSGNASTGIANGYAARVYAAAARTTPSFNTRRSTRR